MTDATGKRPLDGAAISQMFLERRLAKQDKERMQAVLVDTDPELPDAGELPTPKADAPIAEPETNGDESP